MSSTQQTSQSTPQHHTTIQSQPIVSQTITLTPQTVQHIKQEAQDKWIISSAMPVTAPLPQPTIPQPQPTTTATSTGPTIVPTVTTVSQAPTTTVTTLVSATTEEGRKKT